MNISQFHDWTLAELHFDWCQATITVMLNGPMSARQVLTAIDASLLEVPRENPWGKSVSINAIRLEGMPDKDVQALEIEMQSGDVIRINAREIRS